MSRATILIFAILSVLLVYAAIQPVAAQCPPHWVQDVGTPGVDDTVFALASFNDGSGPALYAGGVFNNAGEVGTKGIARWNGTSWSGVGGNGVNVSGISAILVFDDGTGPALYVSGFFNSIGGVPAQSIAKWNGNHWSALGTGVSGTVYAMAALNNGSENSLYVGGNFNAAGGVPAAFAAKWNGTSWSALGTGMDNQIYAMTTFDDGNGPAVYYTGAFSTANGVPCSRIAKWNGATFSAVGNLGPQTGDHIHTVGTFYPNGVPRLFAGGFYFTADGQTVRSVSWWNGASWQPFQNGFNSEPKGYANFDERTGNGLQLFIGGDFTASGLTPTFSSARWNGTAWQGMSSGLNNPVYAAVTHDFGLGDGPSLYVGGSFTTAGGVTSNHVARWTASGTPYITQNPIVTSVIAGQQANFSVTAIGNQSLSYQWQRDLVPLVDGGHVSGATTPSLVINTATGADIGLYRVIATNTCGSTPSAAVALSVNPACSGDLFPDTFVDGLDIPGFVECILTGQNCAGTDLDGDGLNADLDTDDDLSAFTAKLVRANSSCP